MAWLEISALMPVGSAVETGVVYLVSAGAAVYLVRTLVRAFRPGRRRALPQSTGRQQKPGFKGECPGCDRCG